MRRRGFTSVIVLVVLGGCGGRTADDPIVRRSISGNTATGGSLANEGSHQTGGSTLATDSHAFSGGNTSTQAPVNAGGASTTGGNTPNGGATSPGGTGGTWASVAAGGTATTGGASGEACVYKGTTYANGTDFWELDPYCMLCTCWGFGEGFVACSSDPCEVCQFQPPLILAGDTVPKGDGCNTCTCMQGGPGVGYAWMTCTDFECSND